MKVRIRPAVREDADALAEIVIESTVTTFRGLVPAQCLAWLDREESASNWRRWFDRHESGRILLVAEYKPGEVAGCALGGKKAGEAAFDGELFLMGVLPAYQGRSIGRGLVHALRERLGEMGVHAVGVRVMTVNPNCGFYERMGAAFLREESYDWNSVTLPQSVYRWGDPPTAIAASPYGPAIPEPPSPV
jgi:GNAT superfamily N-acetyltransferase